MFNCSEQLTNSMLVRFLYGMIRSGSWVCFENVDCLGAGILSCLGQHLSTIRTSLKCLEKLVWTQYTTRGFHKQGTQEVMFNRISEIWKGKTPYLLSILCELWKFVSLSFFFIAFVLSLTLQVDNVKRRRSVTTLHSLPNEPFMPGSRPDSLLVRNDSSSESE